MKMLLSSVWSALQPKEKEKGEGRPPPSPLVISHWSQLDHMATLAAREAGKWSLKSVWPYAQLSIGKIYYQWPLSCLLIRKYKLFLLGLQCSVRPHPHHSSLGAGL